MLPDVLTIIGGAILCAGILWLTTRLDLARTTLCYLALPYLLFFPGWLNTVAAILLASIFIFCLIKTLLTTTSTHQTHINVHDVAAFLLILVWVGLSGAGGFGYQGFDYTIHNARLFDLINYDWPVHYGENQNLVYYIGYFLPSALLGKISNFDTALQSLYFWTVLGVTLAIRWLSYLTGWRFSVWLVAIFALFGPLDVLNVASVALYSGTSFHDAIARVINNSDFLDFATYKYLQPFIGNYLSNSFQLFSAPQQVIAGWLGISMMTYLYIKKQVTQILFVYALLCLWAPLIMIALFPFVLAIGIAQLPVNWRNLFTTENLLGAGSLAAVFIIFYTAGSAGANPSVWIISDADLVERIVLLVIFYFSGWGIYVLAIQGRMREQGAVLKIWLFCLVLTLVILPLRTFGEWADLLCRGSAPLMFLLLVFILQTVKQNWIGNHRRAAVLLLCLLLPGSISALLQIRTAVMNYGFTQPVASIITYYNAYPNLGPDNTLFERLLRRKLPE